MSSDFDNIVEKVMCADLPSRQFSALKLYNKGYSRAMAASILNVSESTYAWYLRQTRLKFKIKTRQEMLLLEQALLQKKNSS